ncbi:MAG: DUF2721 domain-containing protein [Gammaproteobacteria bacterium]|nr:DUF2721 domain-containing protein [Gammaproteobacteria bacterium]
MNGLGIWVQPLILLPGIGLLILSTATRYGQLHTEFHHLSHEQHENTLAIAGVLMRRAKLFRNTLVSLYIAVALIALSSLIGAISTALSMELSLWLVISLLGFAIAAIVIATVMLILESTAANDIISTHYDALKKHE